MAAADGIAGDHRHHRLGQATDLHLQVEHIEMVHPLLVLVTAVIAAHLLIAARTEGLVAGAGEHDDANVRIMMRMGEGIHELAHRAWPEGVAHLRPVDGDAGNALFVMMVEDVLVDPVGYSLPTHERALLAGMGRKLYLFLSQAFPRNLPSMWTDADAFHSTPPPFAGEAGRGKTAKNSKNTKISGCLKPSHLHLPGRTVPGRTFAARTSLPHVGGPSSGRRFAAGTPLLP
jgi:hypothetical protein